MRTFFILWNNSDQTFYLQSLQDEDLKSLGRDHDSHEALQTIEEARRLCPGRVSVDVMFGRPKQTVESWEIELSELLRVCDDHVSLYQLTLERGTQLFKQVECGAVTMPSEDVTAEMYQRARKTAPARLSTVRGVEFCKTCKSLL